MMKIIVNKDDDDVHGSVKTRMMKMNDGEKEQQ